MNKLVIAVLAGAFLVGCGDDGRNGKNGVNGLPGQAGNDGVSGTNGSNGTDGVNGADGSSCSVEQITKHCAKITCTDGSEAYIGTGKRCPNGNDRPHDDDED